MTLETDLATLLAEGKVESALLLKGDFTDQERNLIRQAYEAGISHGKSSVQAELARLREGLGRFDLFVRWLERDYPAALRAMPRYEFDAIRIARALLAEDK